MDVATSMSPVTMSLTSLLSIDSDEDNDSFIQLDPTPSMMNQNIPYQTLRSFEINNEDPQSITGELEKMKIENAKLKDDLKQNTELIRKQFKSIYNWKEENDKNLLFYKNAVEVLKKRAKELEAENNDLNKQLTRLKQNEQEKLSLLYKNEEDKGKQTAEIIWLREELNSQIQTNAETKQKLKELEDKELSVMGMEEQQLEERHKLLQVISEIQEQMQASESQNEKLKTESQQLSETIDKYEKQVAAYQLEKESLNKTLAHQSSLVENLEDCEKKIEQYKKDTIALNNLKEEKNLAVEKINYLEIEQQCLKAENETLKCLNKEKELLEKTNDSLLRQIEQYETEKESLTVLKGENDASKELINNLQEKAQYLISKNEVIQEEKVVMEAELVRLQSLNKELSDKLEITKALEDFTFVDKKGESISLQEVQTKDSSVTIPKQLESEQPSTSRSSHYYEGFQTMLKQYEDLQNVIKAFQIEREQEKEKLMILEAQEQYHQEKTDTMTAILLSKEQDMEHLKEELGVAVKKNSELEMGIRESVGREMNDLNQKIAQLEEQLETEKTKREEGEQEIKSQQELIHSIFAQASATSDGVNRTYEWQHVENPSVPDNACPKCNQQCDNYEELINHVTECLPD